MSVKILIVDDHKIFRQGLRALLEKRPGIHVSGEAESAAEGIRMASELSPDVIIMDIAMPDIDGIEATRRILETVSRDVKIIALTMYSNLRYATEMLKAGAHGFLMKDCSCDELVEAIKAVRKGKIYLSRWVTEHMVKDYLDTLTGEHPQVSSALTAREKEVLSLIAEGKATREIAAHLHLSVKTVETHRKNIMGKLDIDSMAALIKYAIREGLSSLQ